jgi:hypothetical protein
MKPNDRHDWIAKALETMPGKCADVLNSDFVEDYVEATNARQAIQPYGAAKCPQLGRDLSAMKRAGILKRHRVGIQGMAGMGFPRWVWSYELRDVNPL